MPIFKVISGINKYHDSDSYDCVIRYCFNDNKTPSKLVGGLADNPETTVALMQLHTDSYYKNTGIMLRHMVLSFSESEEVDYLQAYYIAQAVTEYYAAQYQILFVIHEDHDAPHIHFVMNTVDYDGHKYNGTKADYYAFQEHMCRVLKPYGLFLQIDKYEVNYPEQYDF